MRYDSGDAVDRILDPERALRILEEQKRQAGEKAAEQPEKAAADAEAEQAEKPDEAEQVAQPEQAEQAGGANDADEADAPVEDQAALEATIPEIRPGQIIKGTVVQANEKGVLVDVGLKYEGYIPPHEFPSPTDLPEAGSEMDVAVVRVNDDEGSIVLSKKRADYENVWRRILEAHKTGEVLTAMVTERVKGGLRVDLGVQGFVPASQVGVRRLRDLDRMVGRSLRLRVIEAEKEQKKVILSHRMVIEEERDKRKAETLANLVEGGLFKGRVRNLTDYGAFVDLGGVDGLLHISEMAWTRIKHPSEVLKTGETIEVIVLNIDQERNRISLGRKQILPDPWKEAAGALEVGSVVSGKVTRVVPFGAFVQLESGIEGIVPNAELSERRGTEAKDIVKVDEDINVKVLNVRLEERRMTLSLVQAQQEKDRQAYQQYVQANQAARPTLGDIYGEALQQHRDALEAAEAAESDSEEEAEPAQETADASEPEATEEAEAVVEEAADASAEAEGEETDESEEAAEPEATEEAEAVSAEEEAGDSAEAESEETDESEEVAEPAATEEAEAASDEEEADDSAEAESEDDKSAE